MNIKDTITLYQNLGYEYADAESKVCQDIILLKIFKTKYSKHITIKGGVVMHNISNDIRRTTRDLDIDFIKYSLSDESIRKFINDLNKLDDGILISINGDIKSLHHQDYDGKRVKVIIKDNFNNIINTKLDIGVHKLFDIDQDEYCFNIDGKKIELLINSKEQIFVEKIKSLLKLGERSTRYKDIYDFYYLINIKRLNKSKLKKYFQIMIFNDEINSFKNMHDITDTITNILNSKLYRNNLDKSKSNWLEISTDEVINSILKYLNNL